MKSKIKRMLASLLALSLCFTIAACGPTPNNSANQGNNGFGSQDGDDPDDVTPKPDPEIIYDDTRVLTNYEFASSQISGTDALGRSIKAGDATNDGRDVGLFYFLWLGQHPAEQTGVYNISEFEQINEDMIFDRYNESSPLNKYHHWGEPLYGYYNSEDPWVLTRHVELFTAAGIDYLMFDTTNAVIYPNVVNNLLRVLEKYRLQGFNVPKVAFMTNTNSRDTAIAIYNAFYVPSSSVYYPDLWYKPNGKPLIIAKPSLFNSSNETHKKLIDLFEMRAAQWPDDTPKDTSFPWMSWAYPQKNHNGVMSVSVAQHTTAKMSLKQRNRGRGWSPDDKLNRTDRADEGSNIQAQWDTVFKLNSNDDPSDDVKSVFVTGWNEWIALKLNEGDDVFFVDQFNAEYSRDLEMDKTAFGDNYFMQLVDNVHRLKYGDIKHYKHTKATAATADAPTWESVRAYPDFVGDAMERNYRGYVSSITYTDNTNRNDIKEVRIASDDTNAYIRVECANAIGAYQTGDHTFMNVWLMTKRMADYDYVVNYNYGKLSKIEADGKYTDVANVEVVLSGSVMLVTVPLAAIGVDPDDPGFMFKVSDHVDATDVMNFYIQGDCAPIGRLSYTYGYVK